MHAIKPFMSQDPLPYSLFPLISALNGLVDQSFETGTTSVWPDKIIGNFPFGLFAFRVAKRLTLFLVSSKVGVGIKLGRWLDKNIKYKTNWSCCDRKYVKFNERLGFEIKSIDSIEKREVFLLCRKKY